MGMFDEVWFEGEVPGDVTRCRRFQTKDLERLMDCYVVSKTGRLCLVGSALLDDHGDEMPRVPTEADDIDFHGDLRLVPDGGPFEEFIARFTNGTLEWVRPVKGMPPSKAALVRQRLFGEAPSNGGD